MICACHGFDKFEKSLPRPAFDAINAIDAKKAITKWWGKDGFRDGC
jgi:hypothetical protein